MPLFDQLESSASAWTGAGASSQSVQLAVVNWSAGEAEGGGRSWS